MQIYLLKNPQVVRLGNEIREVIIHAPLAFCIGDASAMDTFAAQYHSYGAGTRRISRNCNVHFDQCGNPDAVCEPIPVEPVKQAVMTALQVTDTGDMAEYPKPPTQEEIYAGIIVEGPFAPTAQEVKASCEYLHSISTHVCFNSLWNIDTGRQLVLPLPHYMMHILMTINKTIKAIREQAMVVG
jgi:hypothetical protein